MVKTSKVYGVKLRKREIFVASASEWHHSSTYTHETLLKIFSTIKDASDAIIAKMDESKIEKNHGLRRNVNFVIDMNLETEIVTRADDEGSKKYFIRPEKPFERDISELVDDKDFETELTEDEEEFLSGKVEIGGAEMQSTIATPDTRGNTAKGLKSASATAAENTVCEVRNVVDTYKADSIETKRVAAGDKCKTDVSESDLTMKKMSGVSTADNNRRIAQVNKYDVVSTLINHGIDGTGNATGRSDARIITSSEVMVNETSGKRGRAKIGTKKTQEIAADTSGSTGKSELRSQSVKDTQSMKKMNHKKKNEQSTAKKQRLVDDKQPRRNIFSNFQPKLLRTPTQEEINEYYTDYSIIKNPLRNIRSGNSPYVYYEITGKKELRKRMVIRLKGRKRSVKDELIGKFFVSGDMSDEGDDVKF
ncbi:hypothetical protein VCUG_00589 [Vavraia culicis subsp. floridensis]|uniref:Uncharacterized protein n=1 Tax=Vavraia culicis (isolate floridensis) TaxID=948595 RepID=L2GW81_VAVCU|nr:uncharacterized protein VCUG_00589 [Vavraia culicis subsp. floridensis]ELA47869.1 hypothetical protein VCUG_00589 [Vavraia culicis subsp. floridensis]